MPDPVERFNVALKEHGAAVVVLASDYEKLEAEAKLDRDERIEAEGREFKAKAKARNQRDEELRERAMAGPAQEAGRLALMRGNADDATVAERVETITRAMLDSIFEEADD